MLWFLSFWWCRSYILKKWFLLGMTVRYNDRKIMDIYNERDNWSLLSWSLFLICCIIWVKCNNSIDISYNFSGISGYLLNPSVSILSYSGKFPMVFFYQNNYIKSKKMKNLCNHKNEKILKRKNSETQQLSYFFGIS